MPTCDEILKRQSFRLIEIQQEALKVQTNHDDFPHWGVPAYDLVAYLENEVLKRATFHSKRGAVFWGLVKRTSAFEHGIFGSDTDVVDDGIVAGGIEIVCHCESYSSDAAFRNRNGAIVCGFSCNIGSVFTLPKYRGQGLMKFFLAAVQTRLATKPNVLGSALFSDIGPTLYEHLGWRLHESIEATLDVASLRNTQRITEQDLVNDDKTLVTELLLDEKLEQILERDNTNLLNEMASTKYEGKEVFASLLTHDSIEWQFVVGVHYAKMANFAYTPTCTGAYLDDDAFIVWCHDLNESILYVQHVHFPMERSSAIVYLLRAAIYEAHKFKLATVVLWDPPQVLFHPAVVSQFDIVKQRRTDSHSHLIVFDPYRTDRTSNVLPLWLNNEKLAWV